MKKIICLIIFSVCIIPIYSSAQVNEWVWLHGDSITASPGNFGVQGVPSPLNEPPAFYEPCEWRDFNGNLWIFGGLTFSEYGDLWKYDITTDQWTWMNGSGIAGAGGNYGVQGVPSPTNLPPSRAWGVSTWVDNAGDLWMFGGYGGGTYSDLWKYSIATNEWTWIKGPNTTNQPGVFGTQGVSDPANNPETRAECGSAWTDINNNLWLFGGYPGYRNDLWKYNIAINEWTWMKGSQVSGQAGVYGTMNVEDPANTPGERESYSHWTDASGNLYLFAGRSSAQSYNDFWKYNIVTNNWVWIGGSNLMSQPGHYNTKCVFDSTNMPRERFENRAVCKDQFGNFWLFGGGAQSGIATNLNDLWMYCVSKGEWVWVSGDSTINPVPLYGTRGVSSPLNKPPGKAGAVMWCDQNDHIYVFGGNGNVDKFNDLWKYTIDYSCVPCNQNPVAMFNAPNHICPGTCTDFINLSQNATSYIWTFNGGNPSVSTDASPTNICYNTPGTYSVSLIATNAVGSDTIVLNNYITVYPIPPAQGILQNGDTLVANQGSVSYQWYYNGTIIPGATDYFYVATQSGNYSVIAADENNCEVEAVINNVIANSPFAGSHLPVSVYPNPALDKIEIRNLNQESEISITIYDMPGTAVKFEKRNFNTEIIVDVSELSKGVYYLEILSENTKYRTQFVKQ
jgi:PKD repeat protein